MIQHMSIADQPTCPLPTDAVALQSILQRHGLSLLQMARASGIRYWTAWKVAQGLPVCEADAARLRAGLTRLTGHPSTVPSAVKATEQTARAPMEEWKNGKDGRKHAPNL